MTESNQGARVIKKQTNKKTRGLWKQGFSLIFLLCPIIVDVMDSEKMFDRLFLLDSKNYSHWGKSGYNKITHFQWAFLSKTLFIQFLFQVVLLPKSSLHNLVKVQMPKFDIKHFIWNHRNKNIALNIPAHL